MNSYRRGLRNGVLVNPKIFILEKVNFDPHIKCWSNLVNSCQTWSNVLQTCIIWCGSLQPDPTWTSSPLRGLKRSGLGTAPITSSASSSSTPAILGRNPNDLRGICRGRGVQFCLKGSYTQHHIKGDARNTSHIQTPSAGHYHNLFRL